MKTSEKIQYIQSHLDLFNRTVFKNKNYYLSLVKMAPKYCIRIVSTDHKQLKIMQYNTYDDIISTIEFMKFIFTKEEKK